MVHLYFKIIDKPLFVIETMKDLLLRRSNSATKNNKQYLYWTYIRIKCKRNHQPTYTLKRKKYILEYLFFKITFLMDEQRLDYFSVNSPCVGIKLLNTLLLLIFVITSYILL